MKRYLIIGYGGIGQAIGKRVRSCGDHVHFISSKHPSEPEYIKINLTQPLQDTTTLDALLRMHDFGGRLSSWYS